MQRQYKIGDIITVRGIRYEVRSQREYPFFGYCDHCGFGINKEHCILRLRYRHFLEDCSSVRAYFKRVWILDKKREYSVIGWKKEAYLRIINGIERVL